MWKKTLAARRVGAAPKLPAPTTSRPPTNRPTTFRTPKVPEQKMRESVTYHELEHLGRGGFGSVTRVVDLKWGDMMAVKIVHTPAQREKKMKRKLRKEVEVLAGLSHVSFKHSLVEDSAHKSVQPHIIEYKHSQGWELGKPIEIFMSVADGSLRDRLKLIRERPPRKKLAEIGLVSTQIIDALAYLHHGNYIHRDIKPENILYKDTENLTYYLADFGLTKEVDAHVTYAGTQPYMAPEVWAEHAQECKLDIWSFGLVIYEMLTGWNLCSSFGQGKYVLRPTDWCRKLEANCRYRGDLAKMVACDPNERFTSLQCKESPRFPDLRDILPFAVPPPIIPGRSCPSARQTSRQRSTTQNRSVILAPANPSRVSKARGPGAAQSSTRRPIGTRSGPGRR